MDLIRWWKSGVKLSLLFDGKRDQGGRLIEN